MSARPDRPVSTIMSWPVATSTTWHTGGGGAEALAADSIGALVVLSEGRLAGIISERDVVTHIAAGTDLSHLLTGEAMASDLVTVQSDDTILMAARAMAEADIRHLPVLRDKSDRRDGLDEGRGLGARRRRERRRRRGGSERYPCSSPAGLSSNERT